MSGQAEAFIHPGHLTQHKEGAWITGHKERDLPGHPTPEEPGDIFVPSAVGLMPGTAQALSELVELASFRVN
jgi:hypothetical protein